MPCCATPEAVVGNPAHDRSNMDLLIIIRICIIWQTFYAGCPSYRNPPHLSGVETVIKKYRNAPPKNLTIFFKMFELEALNRSFYINRTLGES